MTVPGGPVHVVCAHLDPRGPPGYAWLGVAGRATQTEYLLQQVPGDLVVLGADLNLGRGRRERTWRLLHEAGFACGVPPVDARTGVTPFTRCPGWCSTTCWCATVSVA